MAKNNPQKKLLQNAAASFQMVQKNGTIWTLVFLFKTSIYGEALRIFFQEFGLSFNLPYLIQISFNRKRT
jgi:hypothetical protein